MSCQGTSVVTVVVVTTTSRLHQLSPLLSQLNKRKQKNRRCSETGKEPSNTGDWSRALGSFFPIPSQDSSPPANHHNPLTCQGASGRNRGISANENSVASGRAGERGTGGRKGVTRCGAAFEKGIALQVRFSGVKGARWTALAFVFLVIHCRIDGFWRLIASHCASLVDLNPFCTGGPEATRHPHGREGLLDPNLVEDGRSCQAWSCRFLHAASRFIVGDAWEKGFVVRAHPTPHMQQLGSCQLDVMHRSAVE